MSFLELECLMISKGTLTKDNLYFIADIAANHDGELSRALDLIELAAASGANAAKFQNFKAETIVSARGFEELGKFAHQKNWKRSVFDVYKSAEVPIEWTEHLHQKCKEVGIEYFTAPYDLDMISKVEPFVPYFKIGSGDINWKQSLDFMLTFSKPIIVATGASTMWEVERTVSYLLHNNAEVILMQCNTNYTGEDTNYQFLNLNVIRTYKENFPNLQLGLSDHTRGIAPILGAIALGATVFERHFTDDRHREGPDHYFSLEPEDWRQMVSTASELLIGLGDGVKRIEENELESRIVQRRAVRTRRSIRIGDEISMQDLICLRPCPENGIDPFEIERLVGRRAKRDIGQDALVTWDDIE